MKYGYAVQYWPDTTAVKSSYPATDQDILNEGYVFVETTEDFNGMPVDDPRFYPEIEFPAKRNELRKACEDEIIRSSFQSTALGAIHNYDCRLVDQVNLQTRYSLSQANGSPEPIYASDGTRFQWLPHTAEEMLEVMLDMNDHIKLAQVKLATKLAAVDLAVTRDDLDLIVW